MSKWLRLSYKRFPFEDSYESRFVVTATIRGEKPVMRADIWEGIARDKATLYIAQLRDADVIHEYDSVALKIEYSGLYDDD